MKLYARSSFEFMAILAVLSLSGMLIKNAIVLVDQIDLEIKEGKERFTAVINSAVSRARPVAMGAITTVLGVTSLLLTLSSRVWQRPLYSGLHLRPC